MIPLTVCIPTVPSRRSLLSRLLFWLSVGQRAEILVADGIRPMGDKLNEMFAAARGDYVVAIDDDDVVVDGYVELINMDTRHRADFIGHDILWLEDGCFAGLVKHSLDGDPLWRGLNRGVSPKCPVRTTIARKHTFGNHYTADREWSQAVHADCTLGSYLAAPLYIYDHWNDHMVGTEPGDSRFERPQRDVGMWPYDETRVTWI